MASTLYELIVYCSGSELYCSAIIDCLERSRKYFSHRLYNDNLLRENSSYLVKNYEFLFGHGRTDDNVIIVDHSVASFCMRVTNGIPIQEFTFSLPPKNPELICLAKYLVDESRQKSIRKYIEETLTAARGLHSIY